MAGWFALNYGRIDLSPVNAVLNFVVSSLVGECRAALIKI